MKKYKIAYVGNFEPRHSTENHLKSSLELLGHEVIPFQENHYTNKETVLLAEILKHEPTLFLFTRTWGDAVTHWVLEGLRDAKIPSVSYHLDLYHGISREAGISDDPFWRTDYVFTPDGGSQEGFYLLGINHHYLKPGVFQPECYEGTYTPELAHEVAFVGSYGYHPEWPYRPKLINWLNKTYGDRFYRFGSPDPTYNNCNSFTVRNEELNNVYASNKVIVGDTLCVDFTHPYYWSDRVYETLGRGGFLIHPWIEGMQDEFVNGKHLIYYEYNNFEQLQGLIDYYLIHDKEREVIRKAGHAFVKENATYTNRLQQMFEVLENDKSI